MLLCSDQCGAGECGINRRAKELSYRFSTQLLFSLSFFWLATLHVFILASLVYHSIVIYEIAKEEGIVKSGDILLDEFTSTSFLFPLFFSWRSRYQ